MAIGNRTSVTRADNALVNYSYDNIGQLMSAVGQEASTLLRANENFSYGYDPAGNLATRTNNTLIQSFATDNANQLMNVTRNNDLLTVAGSLVGSNNFTVNGQDAAIYGDLTFALTNGISIVNGMNTFTAVATSNSVAMTNQLLESLPVTVNLGYDKNGNLVSDGVHGYDYDDANELSRITATNILKAEFVYDGFGRRRIRKDYAWQTNQWVQTNEIHYVYDGMLVIQERASNNVPLVSYTRGVDFSGSLQGAGGIGGLLARTDGSGSAFYHSDGNGNITMMVNSSGDQLAKYLYDSFGNMLGMWGSQASMNHYRFSSKEFDVASGLYDYSYRYYQPNLQRWLNRDPIRERGGINLYAYADNSSVNLMDFFGLAPGDKFKTRDDAARDALKYIYPMTQSDNNEHGGVIYQNPDDGTYSYTAPNSGKKNPETGVNDEVDVGFCPKDKDYRGFYHSHPKVPLNSGYKHNEEFIGMDRLAAEENKDHGAKNPQPGYLIPPSGKMLRYDPDGHLTGPVRQIGHY